MIVNNNILLAQNEPIPDIPASFNVMFFAPGVAHARVSARQLDLEPSVAGVDRAMSWSVWVCASNIYTNTQRVFGSSETAGANQQYALQINDQSLSGANAGINQKLRFVLFTDSSNFITIDSTNIFLRNRWTHIVITYDGSEDQSGFEMYLNGVLDSTATKSETGSYTGARNSANLRFMVSRVDTASLGRYGGDQTTLAIWDKELNQTEVDELYNFGVPIDVDTVSFYGNIEAYWSLKTGTTCSNNATFNFSSVNNITTRNIPVGPNFDKLSIFRAHPADTNYVSFGSAFLVSGNFYWNGRSSVTSHLAGGDIVKITFDRSTYAVGTKTTIINDADDLRAGSAGIIDTDIYNFTSRFSNPTFLNQGRYVSTDGLTGETFGSITTMATTLANFNFYGKIIEDYTPGDYIVSQFEFTSPNYQVNIWRRIAGVWSKTNVWSGTTEGLTESAICLDGAGGYIMLCRSDLLNDLYLITSADGVTWTSPQATTLATGISNADMVLDPDGNLTVIFMDRATDRISISPGNVIADILADPTDWVAPSEIFESYTTDSLGILGYPTIWRDEFHYFVAFSAEFSSSRADLYLGYGIIGLGGA